MPELECIAAHRGGQFSWPLLRMVQKQWRWPGLLAVLLLLISSSLAGQEPPQEPRLFLEKQLAFSHDQLLQVAHGAVVAKILKPRKHEVAAVAVVRVNVPQEFFLARFRDIEQFKKGPTVPLVNKFSDPVRLDDLRDMVLLPQEVNDLKNCRPGQCTFKLSDQQIQLIHQQVDWEAADAAEQTVAAVRRILADYVRSYAAEGNKAMLSYHDKQVALNTVDQFHELVEGSSFLLDYAPDFRDYLYSFPDAALPSAENFIYWSRENYGHTLKPVITITHVTIDRRPNGSKPAVLIASKQIYGSHYFEASLGLTVLFRAMPSDPTPSFYLVYLSRTRIDLLRKWYSGLARGRLSETVRSSMRANMFETKTRLEAEYKASQAPAAPPARFHDRKRRQR